MATCGNCKKKLGCSCKVRKATDGRSCCASCVTNYNNILKQKQKTSKTTTSTVGVIINATAKQTE